MQEEKRLTNIEFERKLQEDQQQQALMATQMLNNKEKNEKLLKHVRMCVCVCVGC